MKSIHAEPHDHGAEGDERIRTAVCEPGTTYTYDASDEPIKRHWGWKHDPHTALCGERLIGVPAPESHPHVCEECERLHLEWVRDKFGGAS